MRRVGFVALVAAAFLGCGDGGEEAIAPERVTAEVEVFLDRYVEHTTALDVPALVDMYSASPDFFWVEAGRGETYESRAEIEAALASLSDAVTEISLAIEDVRIAPAGAGAAAVSFGFRESMAFQAGGGFELEGVATAVLIREGDAWRFLAGQVTAGPATPEGEGFREEAP